MGNGDLPETVWFCSGERYIRKDLAASTNLCTTPCETYQNKFLVVKKVTEL